MNSRKWFRVLLQPRVIKLCSLVILIVLARQAFADCESSAQDGWSIGKVCVSRFNSEGWYFESGCEIDQYESPAYNWHAMCKEGIDRGTCSGSNCQGSRCTWHGRCERNTDCCGLNTCDPDGERCSETVSTVEN